MLKKYLDDLESRINPEVEDELFEQWRRFWDNKMDEDIFYPARKTAAPSSLEWPSININDAINDTSFETMLLSQLCSVNAFLPTDVDFIWQYVRITAAISCLHCWEHRYI